MNKIAASKQDLRGVQQEVTDHAVASEKAVEQAAYAAETIAHEAESQKKEAEATLEHDETAARAAVEEEEDEIGEMRAKDSVAGKRMGVALTTLDEKTKDFGNGAVDKITNLGHKIESQAAIFRTSVNTGVRPSNCILCAPRYVGVVSCRFRT